MEGEKNVQISRLHEACCSIYMHSVDSGPSSHAGDNDGRLTHCQPVRQAVRAETHRITSWAEQREVDAIRKDR